MKNKKSNAELMKEFDLIKGEIIMDNFNNIIGYNHIKNELNRIIDCINNRDKYERLGVKIPKNLLLFGDPGVGKTLFANAFINALNRNRYIIRGLTRQPLLTCHCMVSFSTCARFTWVGRSLQRKCLKPPQRTVGLLLPLDRPPQLQLI